MRAKILQITADLEADYLLIALNLLFQIVVLSIINLANEGEEFASLIRMQHLKTVCLLVSFPQ